MKDWRWLGKRAVSLFLAMLLGLVPLFDIGFTPAKVSANGGGGDSNWDLVFEDNFDGTTVDTTKWNIEDWPSDRNQELQYYAPDDVFVEDGNLVLRSQKRTYTIPEGKKNAGQTREYTSGAVNTLNKFNLTYGKVEVRGKVPKSQGYWPAIWLNAVSGWPPEFDIIEFLGHEPTVLHTNNHWGKFPNNGQVGGSYKGSEDLSEEFHVYGFEWDPGEIRYYLDGNLIRTYTYSGKLVKNGGLYDAISNEPMYLILNTAIGGSWPGSPDETSIFPQQFLIDYVKMYQRSPTSKVLENLAKNKTATSNSPSWEGNEPAKATDNNSNTFWYPYGGSNHELQVDLGQVYSNVNGTEISWDSASRYPYKIEMSADGNTWTTVKDRMTETGRPLLQTSTDTFAPVDARYIKLTINQELSGVMELKVFNGTLTDPPQPPVAEPPRTPAKVVSDPFNNLTKGAAGTVLFDRSTGWSLITNYPQFMDNDTSRAQRAENTMKWITYKIDDVASFKLTAYAWGSTANSGIFAGKTKIFASPDNANWTELELTYTNGQNNNSWYRAVITPKNPIPAGSKYFKVELHPTSTTENDTWKYCLGQFDFIQDNVVVDELNTADSDKVLESSGNWSLVTDHPADFENDPGRWSPADSQTASIIYNYNDIHDFAVKLFSLGSMAEPGNTGKLKVYTSSDMENWSLAEIEGSGAQSLAGGWYSETFSPAEALPYKADYLKLEIAGGGIHTHYQLSQAEIHYGIPQPEKELVIVGKPMKTAIADRGTPVIDGQADGIWNNTQTLVTDRRKARLPGPSGANVKTLWDESNLYVLADVIDPVVNANNPKSYGDWDEDSVEIYVDENNSKSTTYDANDFQYRVNYAGKLSANTNLEAAVKLTDTGYLVEAKIPFKTITAHEGLTIGFDIQVSDDPGTGHRQYIASWNSEDERQSVSMFTIGDLILGQAKPPLDPFLAGVALDRNQTLLIVGETHQSIVTSVTEHTGAQSVVSLVYGTVTEQAVFVSSNPEVAAVDASGMIHAVGAGQADITATYNGKTAVNKITVLPVTDYFVEFAHPTYSLAVGTTHQSVVQAVYETRTSPSEVQRNAVDVSAYATYQSADPTVAEVDSTGLVRAIAEGNTVVTATYNGETAASAITVVLMKEFASIALDSSQYELSVGQSHQSAVHGEFKVTPSIGNSYFVTEDLTAQSAYGTSNPAVASVDLSGLVRALSAGQTVITATYNGETATAAVTVSAAPSFPTEPPTEVENTPAPPQPTSNVVVSPGSIAVKPAVGSDGKARGDLTEEQMRQALSNSKGNLKIIMDAPAGTKKAQLAIPASSLASMASAASNEKLELDLGIATLSFTMKELGNQLKEESRSVEVQVSLVAEEAVPAKVKTSIGNIPVYDFNLSVDGVTIPEFTGRNSVEISVPYALSPGADPRQVVIYFISEEGKLEIVRNSKYDAAAGEVSFRPKQVGFYSAAVNSVSFNDIFVVPWADDAIRTLAARGAIEGDGKGSFRPHDSITRAEFIKLLVGMVDLAQEGAASTFTDVSPADWYAQAVASAEKAGIINGKADGSFGANDLITRQDMAVILDRTSAILGIKLPGGENRTPFTDHSEISPYALEAVERMYRTGLINGMGDGFFAPQQFAERSHAAVMLYHFFMLE